jgi:hypothetical protein
MRWADGEWWADPKSGYSVHRRSELKDLIVLRHAGPRPLLTIGDGVFMTDDETAYAQARAWMAGRGPDMLTLTRKGDGVVSWRFGGHLE